MLFTLFHMMTNRSLLKNIFGLGICLPVRIATGDYLFAG
jgi:hypothetical protein